MTKGFLSRWCSAPNLLGVWKAAMKNLLDARVAYSPLSDADLRCVLEDNGEVRSNG